MFTVGKEHHTGRQVPLFINNDGTLLNSSDDVKRYCLFFVEEGAGSIEFSGFKEIFIAPVLFCFHENEQPKLMSESKLKGRTLYFHPSYVNHRFDFESLRFGSPDFYLTDERDRNWLKAFYEKTEQYKGRICINLLQVKRFTNLFNMLDTQLNEQPDFYWPCRSRSYLIEILFLLEQAKMISPVRELTTDIYSEEISQVILYLHTHYDEKITIPMLVKKFNIDRNTLTKKFSTETHDSIINYLIKLRINFASSLLRDTFVPISEICSRVGFSDLSHFNRTFKKFCSFSPSEYRSTHSILL